MPGADASLLFQGDAHEKERHAATQVTTAAVAAGSGGIAAS